MADQVHIGDGRSPHRGNMGLSGILITAGIVVLVGFADFTAWFDNGTAMFWSLVQTGLAWCL